ncbi:ABC-2 transporter permease [Solibacillus sp. FSL W8-0372]|uniref:ABC-2 transporter permease n=1 Tax=Solibacillus sp. FSL W8-0372 TaxID=2921713 RepID=UPI0030CD23CA
MYQLVKKDLIIHKKMLMGMFLVLLAYMYVDVQIIFIGLIFSWTFALNIFSTDEKRPAQMLLSSLPFTRKEIVSSKYISAILFILLIILMITGGSLLFQQALPNGLHLLMIAIGSLFIVAFIYPVSYKFASRYLNIAFFVCLAIYLVIVKFFIHNLNDRIRETFAKIMNLGESQLILYTGVILVITYSLSWLLSIRIFEKKVF